MILKLFINFFQIGLFSFGGGYAMIPLIQSIILKHNWLTLSEISDMIAISEMTPGPFAINISTFTGAKMAGVTGALFATFGVVLPSFIIILLIYKFYESYKNHFIAKSILIGIRPAVVGLIASAAITLSKTSFLKSLYKINGFTDFFKTADIKLILLALACGAAVLKFKIHPIILISLSAVAGIVLFS